MSVDKVIDRLGDVIGADGDEALAIVEAARSKLEQLAAALEPGAMPCACIVNDARVDNKTGAPVWAPLCRCSHGATRAAAHAWCERANQYEKATGRGAA